MRYTLLVLFIISCTPDADKVSDVGERVTISEAELIISPENNPEYGQISTVKSIGERLLIYDYGLQTIFVADEDANPEFSFGREGGGPGEFQSVTGMWFFEDHFLIYDPRSAKHLIFSDSGNYLEDRLVEQENYSNTLEAVGLNRFYIPSGGDDGSLLKFTDLAEGSDFTFGISANPESSDIDFNNARQALERGQVPDFMKNQLALSANESGLFSFRQATGLLQKFSHDGEPEWEKQLNFDFMDQVFDEFIERNKIMMERGNIILLHYANHLEATSDGITLMMNTPEDIPATLVWYSNDGEESAVITLDLFEEPSEKPRIFSVSEVTGSLYLTNFSHGLVHKTNWPL